MERVIVFPMGKSDKIINYCKGILNNLGQKGDRKVVVPEIQSDVIDSIYANFNDSHQPDGSDKDYIIQLIDYSTQVILVGSISSPLTGTASLIARYTMETPKKLMVFDTENGDWKSEAFLDFVQGPNEKDLLDYIDFEIKEVAEYMAKVINENEQWPPKEFNIGFGHLEFDYNSDHCRRVMYSIEHRSWTLARYNDEQYLVFDNPSCTEGYIINGELIHAVPPDLRPPEEFQNAS